jgi:LAS superfamily LD-carboxypeptidase LdcB
MRDTAAYHWLVANAATFGFYPYDVEPWHWEYNPPWDVPAGAGE